VSGSVTESGRLNPRPWTMSEVAVLRTRGAEGAAALAELLDRTPYAVWSQARRMRISLRRSGEVRGRRLALPGPVAPDPGLQRALDRLRADVAAGRVNPVRLERRAALLARGAPLCPACAMRPIESELTGLCADCHLRRLLEAHELEADAIAAERNLAAARQRKHRLGAALEALEA
jgi:hypothetical protein